MRIVERISRFAASAVYIQISSGITHDCVMVICEVVNFFRNLAIQSYWDLFPRSHLHCFCFCYDRFWVEPVYCLNAGNFWLASVVVCLAAGLCHRDGPYRLIGSWVSTECHFLARVLNETVLARRPPYCVQCSFLVDESIVESRLFQYYTKARLTCSVHGIWLIEILIAPVVAGRLREGVILSEMIDDLVMKKCRSSVRRRWRPCFHLSGMSFCVPHT